MWLPIHPIESAFRSAVEVGPVVVTAATGSGKSTEVPRWCPRPVVVVEPRRVACRALAARVAELEGTRVGERVGYVVRDDVRAGPETEIRFITPGVALRDLATCLRAATFVLDEVHERTLDLDLLWALARGRARRFVAMSASIDADALAEALCGRVLRAEGRTHPVRVEHDDGGPTVPTPERLVERVCRTLEGLSLKDADVLVFLPGKAEIQAVRSALGRSSGWRVCGLHGGLSLEEQAEAFAPSDRPKVILSTNVAETSVTVPNVRTVIDAGLVRQVRYHQGRAALTLVPVARDAAEQRAGRAGRTAPGRCLRLWGRNAHLGEGTPPEIHRLSLVSLVLAARAHGRAPEALPWLDPPKDHALDAARDELRRLGALDDAGGITARGRRLFELPLDPWLGRVLVEAERADLLDPAIDLAAALQTSRPLFEAGWSEGDLREVGCDLVASVRAVRAGGGPATVQASLREAAEHRARLRRLFGRPGPGPGPEVPWQAQPLRDAILRADPDAARVLRRRGRRVVYGGSGPELEPDPRSAVTRAARTPGEDWPAAVAVLAVRALREGTKNRSIATAMTPVTLARLDALGLGQPRLGTVRWERGRVWGQVERVWGGRVLGTEDRELEGPRLRQAVVRLILEGALHPGLATRIRDRLEAWALARRLGTAGLLRADTSGLEEGPTGTDVASHLQARLETLGLEAGEEVELVDPEDLLPPGLPFWVQDVLDRDYPRRVDLHEAVYRVRYDLKTRRAVLFLESGSRRAAPARRLLPRFPGFKISVEANGTTFDLG